MARREAALGRGADLAVVGRHKEVGAPLQGAHDGQCAGGAQLVGFEQDDGLLYVPAGAPGNIVLRDDPRYASMRDRLGSFHLRHGPPRQQSGQGWRARSGGSTRRTKTAFSSVPISAGWHRPGNSDPSGKVHPKGIEP